MRRSPEDMAPDSRPRAVPQPASGSGGRLRHLSVVAAAALFACVNRGTQWLFHGPCVLTAAGDASLRSRTKAKGRLSRFVRLHRRGDVRREVGYGQPDEGFRPPAHPVRRQKGAKDGCLAPAQDLRRVVGEHAGDQCP